MSHNVKEAKNNLSNLIRLAEKGQPQVIKRHEKDVAVVVSIEDWKKAGGKQETLLEFLQNSPLGLILDDLDNRSQETPRDFSFDE
ncbi:MAG TPA: type II toxin-antitoxin system Phd/YefM family antitoxin [Pyrinomonadaceae bacterium]|nr:type II toxin-antitoxin system Phd/YefM family antitoxin [Pyrinomonadaceae bacterium]